MPKREVEIVFSYGTWERAETNTPVSRKDADNAWECGHCGLIFLNHKRIAKYHCELCHWRVCTLCFEDNVCLEELEEEG